MGDTGSSEDKWETGCTDGSNDFGAGGICRKLGFKHGKSTKMPKKVKVPVEPFGWTNVGCNYDDTYIESESCNARRYGEGFMSPMCNKKTDTMAVKCYNNKWMVQLHMKNSSKKKTQSLYCKPTIIKEDAPFKLSTAAAKKLHMYFMG